MPEVSPYLIVPVVTIFVSQILKFAVHGFSNEIDFKQLIRRDGTPNSAIAVVTSLLVTALAVDGISSSVAGLALVLGGLYLWDKVSELGRLEVAYGALAGLVSGVILSVKYWKDDLNWFFDLPQSNEIRNGFIFFGVVLAMGEILSYMARRKSMRKLPTSRKLNHAFRLSLTLPAVIGIVITFAQQQSLGLLDNRIGTYVVIKWMILATIWFWWRVYRHAKVHLAEEAEHFKATKVREKKKKSKKKKRK